VGEEVKICAIFGAGEVNDYEAIAAMLPAGAFIIAADGGLSHLIGMGLTPHLVIGDFDSYRGLPPQGVPVIRHSSVKDFSDMEASVDYAVEHGFNQILIFGGMGGRLDHTLGNLALLYSAQYRGASAMLLDESTVVMLLKGGVNELVNAKGSHLSLFPYSVTTAKVALEGMEYSGDEIYLRTDNTLGLSNEIVSNKAAVTVYYGYVMSIITDARGKK
jgi:thiamine pyrophosphokinase